MAGSSPTHLNPRENRTSHMKAFKTPALCTTSAAWLFQDQSAVSVNNAAIGTAIADLKMYIDAEGMSRVEELTELLSDIFRPDERLSHVTLATLMFARKAMMDLADSVVEIEAEIEARESRMARRQAKKMLSITKKAA
jgi:hypothetical protein